MWWCRHNQTSNDVPESNIYSIRNCQLKWLLALFSDAYDTKIKDRKDDAIRNKRNQGVSKMLTPAIKIPRPELTRTKPPPPPPPLSTMMLVHSLPPYISNVLPMNWTCWETLAGCVITMFTMTMIFFFKSFGSMLAFKRFSAIPSCLVGFQRNVSASLWSILGHLDL